MNRFYSVILFVFLGWTGANAQCPTGHSTATLNWDYLDFLTNTGTYAGFVTPAMMNTQQFAFGVNRLTVELTGPMTVVGDNATNTAEAGSFGAGADVEFNGTGTITVTLDKPVFNFKFSVYDVDISQILNVTAQDGSGTALNIQMAPVTAGVIGVTGDNTTNCTASATNTTLANNDTRGTVNVIVAGASPGGTGGVKKIVIFLNRIGNWWISDFSACVAGAFPNNWYANMEPWVGQPSYYLVTPDNNSVYLFNPANGKADFLFSEPGSPWINSLAHDPVNRIVYYTRDNPSPMGTNRMLRKWDANTETVSTVIPDLGAFGIPMYEIVVESAGAAFYNGSLFLGIEGTNNNKNSGRESIVWRIDFDAAQNPIRASQVFAMPADNGNNTLTHDWGDFSIKDGTLYDFNTGNQNTTAQFVHFNMQNGNSTIFNTNGNPAPIQVGQTWDGKLWWTGGQGSLGEGGRVARYNENGTIGGKITATATRCSPNWVGRAGDASDPYRPKSDFGDAPDSYDPDPRDMATHEYDCNLRLGELFDREWIKTSSSTAVADGDDEDGCPTLTVLSSGGDEYFTQDVIVYNNTGKPATLAGWLDHDGNGMFDPHEARLMTVPSSPAPQVVTLSWLGIPVTLPGGSLTFLRVRVTQEGLGMDEFTPNSWFANGEVEDYQISIDNILPVSFLDFRAMKQGSVNKLTWIVEKEKSVAKYGLERSGDGINWTNIATVDVTDDVSLVKTYVHTDQNPFAGNNYYRIRVIEAYGKSTYSQTRLVTTDVVGDWMRVAPNPVSSSSKLIFYVSKSQTVNIEITDIQGRVVRKSSQRAFEGINQVSLSEVGTLPSGTYAIRLQTVTGVIVEKVVKR